MSGKGLARVGLIVALCVLAVASAGVGVHNALADSQDLQWSPALLAVHGINPYAAALAGSPDIILAQFPNYLALLYLVMAPLGLMPFAVAKIVWAIVNVLLAAGAAVLVARWLRMSSAATVALAAVMLIATPTRTAIGNGQQALLVLVLALLAFRIARTGPAGVLLGAALTKYSFGPLALVELIRGRWVVVVGALGTLCGGVIALSAITATPPLLLAVQPLLVSRYAVGPGVADLMTIVDAVVGVQGSIVGYVAAAVGCLVLTALVAGAVHRGDGLVAVACGSLVALLTFKHLVYDLVFLLPVLAVALRAKGWPRAVVVGVVGYFWFAVRIAGAFGLPLDAPQFVVPSFALLSLTLFATLKCASQPGAQLGREKTRSICTTRPLAPADGAPAP